MFYFKGKSAIAFSVHPVTEDRNQMIIEAGFGLGEAIVSGQITPDSYVVEKEPRRIIDSNITTQTRALHRGATGGNEWRELSEAEGSKPTLNEKQILELAKIILRIENHYGFPSDIEWALEAGKFYITQSRPITTLNEQSKPTGSYFLSYTREFCVIMGQAWLFGFQKLLHDLSLTGKIPIPFIEFFHDGKIEYWENEIVLRAFQDALYKVVQEDEYFFERWVNIYRDSNKKIESLSHKDPAATIEELQTFLNILYEGIAGWTVMYYTGLDERMTRNLREKAEALRLHDAMGDVSDRFIRKSLLTIFPALNGLVTVLMAEELNNLPSEKELSARKKHSVLFVRDALTKIIPILLDQFESEHNEYRFIKTDIPLDTSEIKGQVAYAGIARGKARLLKRTQINEMQGGEILVTAMTTPDFLPAMKKAVAFVTDEGGIMCHAAIVARELKKPCIIGTKYATQLLKDGDMVEVDANKGIVKIMERKI